jgi:hypothetical protein
MYNNPKEEFGGSDNEAWIEKSEGFKTELCNVKTIIGKKTGESGGDMARLMDTTCRWWNADGLTLLKSGIHTCYIMVSDLASSSVAHSQNTVAMNSPPMESWYKTHLNPSEHIGDVYKYILAQQMHPQEVDTFEAGNSCWHQMMETQDMHHTKAACSQ